MIIWDSRRFSDEDIPLLLEFLQNNSNVVTSLILSHNEISCHGFKLLIEYLTSVRNKNQTYLYHNYYLLYFILDKQ